MTRIDRYLLVLYFRVLLICFGSLSGLLIVIHVFTNLDEFIEYGKIAGGLPRVLAGYYGPYLLQIFDRLGGILALLAVMFVVAWLYRTNELTALMAAGISKGRVVGPLLVASGLVVILAVINREFLIPRFADTLGKTPQDLQGKHTHVMRPIDDVDQGITIFGRDLYPTRKEISDPIFRLEGPAHVLGSQITGSVARFLPSDQHHPQGYLVEGVRSPADVHLCPSVQSGTQKYVLTPKDNPWLREDQCFVVSHLDYELLESGNHWRQYASTWGLFQRIRTDPRYFGDDIRLAVHSRLLRPALDMSLILLGLPIVLIRSDRNLFWVAGASLVLVAGFSGVVMAFQSLAVAAILAPWIAAWAPVLIFLPWATTRCTAAMQT
jgi:lipopolysaccharide export system permease protein